MHKEVHAPNISAKTEGTEKLKKLEKRQISSRYGEGGG